MCRSSCAAGERRRATPAAAVGRRAHSLMLLALHCNSPIFYEIEQHIRAVTASLPHLRRPPSKEELAARTQQVVRCDEAMRAVTLMQQVPGSKAAQQTRTYHFDKVRGAVGTTNVPGGVARMRQP